MVILNQMNNMNKVMKHVTLVFAVGVAVASSILVANATVVDLGERHLGAALRGKQAAIDFIVADQSLDHSLTYLNAFDADGDWDNAQGAVDSSYFGATMIDGGVHANISWPGSKSRSSPSTRIDDSVWLIVPARICFGNRSTNCSAAGLVISVWRFASMPMKTRLLP